MKKRKKTFTAKNLTKKELINRITFADNSFAFRDNIKKKELLKIYKELGF